MHYKFSMVNFIKSTALGAAVASILLGVLTMGTMSKESGWAEAAWACPMLIIYSTLMAVPFVIVCGIIFGLPVTFLLKRRQWEKSSAYIVAGGVIGLIAPTAVCVWLFSLSDPDKYMFVPMAIIGAISGAATGQAWWIFARRAEIAGVGQSIGD